MNKTSRENIISALDTIFEMINHINISKKDFQYIDLCIESLNAIKNRIENSRIMCINVERLIAQIECEIINYKSKKLIDFQNFLDLIEELKSRINNTNIVKPLIVFMPYKFSMWDSLKSIYEEAIKSQEFDVHLMPLPYYELNHENEKNYVYEGDKFQIEGYDIKKYDISNLMYESPDLIFLHNIYDEYNTLTMIDENYHTKNLKKINCKIVYVPYYMSTFIPFKKEEGFYPYSLPSIDYIDDYIVMNKFELDTAKKEHRNAEKFVSIGSPKLDYVKEKHNEMITKKAKEFEVKNNKKKDTVYFLDTGCMFFSLDPFGAYKQILDILSLPKYFENTKVIWRPHPLMLASIKKYTPYLISVIDQLLDSINNVNDHYFYNVYMDSNETYIEGLLNSDVYIGKNSSLMSLAVYLNKNIIVIGEEFPERCLISKERFTFLKENSIYSYSNNIKQEDKQNNQRILNEVFNDSNLSSGKRIMNYVKEKYFQPIQ